ncbi:MAG TPA: response regulator [Cellvibrio sp.]|nr:response regulator [Cellvibrio sp.]
MPTFFLNTVEWSHLLLGALLIIAVVIAYIIKRRDNQRLAALKQDLQTAHDQLVMVKRKAEDAGRAKSEFLSLMSHELRTPLQAVIGYTDVVIEELKRAGDESHLNDLNQVVINSERLLKQINGLLEMANMELGRMERDLTEVKIVEPETCANHVVMIDDDPAFLDIMARTIRAEGYQVHTASDAESGWRLIHAIKPGVITLDLFLPDQHGWTLFERIKADPAIAHIPVIVISMIEERKRFNRQPAEEYLTKPVKRETLKLAIQRLAPHKNA